MLNREYLPQVRWVDVIGTCAECGKAANGWLMNFRNEKVARVCTRCSKLVKLAHRLNEKRALPQDKGE